MGMGGFGFRGGEVAPPCPQSVFQPGFGGGIGFKPKQTTGNRGFRPGAIYGLPFSDAIPNVARMSDQAPPTADEPRPDAEVWEKIVHRPEFEALLAAKRRFIVPCCVFFLLYYFALLYFVGWHLDLMKKPVLGKVNVAYLFALSQFFMAWGMAWLYMRKAAAFDRAAADLLAKENL